MVNTATRCRANLIKTFIAQGDPASKHANSYLTTLFRTHVSQEFSADTIKIPSYFSGDFFATIREVWKEKNGELLGLTTRGWQNILLERGITHVKDQEGTPGLIETEQEQSKPQVKWSTCWEMTRCKGLSPSQKSTLFCLVQNLFTNGERLCRTGLKERPACDSCGNETDDRTHMFNCPSFPRTSSGVQKLPNHLTGNQSDKEDLAILHVELLNPDHQLPFTFLMAELIKNLSTQRKSKKREDWNLLEANILAKTSFLDHIPHLAHVSTTISEWLKNFFDMPASAPTAPTGLNPPPSADSAAGTGGRDTGDLGVVGKVQSHLITSYFHARPRQQLPVSHTASLHASQQASLPSSAAAAPPSVKLATQQNPATRAEATTQRNSPAAHLPANSPGSQQWAANPLTSPPTGETISSEAEPDVQEQTGANQPGEDGRHYLRDILPRVVRGPPGHRAVTGGRRPSPPDPRR